MPTTKPVLVCIFCGALHDHKYDECSCGVSNHLNIATIDLIKENKELKDTLRNAPDQEKIEHNQEKVWMKFIADWKLGSINSWLGQALQDKFQELIKIKP